MKLGDPNNHKHAELHDVKVVMFCAADLPTRASGPIPSPDVAAECQLLKGGAVSPAREKDSGFSLSASSSAVALPDMRPKQPESLLLGSLDVHVPPIEIRLPHPSEPSVICFFMVVGNNLYEINGFSRSTGATSLILQEVDCILGNSPVLLVTPLDPLFLFASLLYRHASAEFQPLKDVLKRSACTQDVHYNLHALAVWPQVCQRLHLISDTPKAEKKNHHPFTPTPSVVREGDIKASIQRENSDIHLDDCYRFSMAKTAQFLRRILRRSVDAVLQQQRKQQKQHERHPYEEPPSQVFHTADLLQPHPVTLGVTGKMKVHKSSPTQEENLAAAIAAAERVVEDYISGYLPKTLLEELKQQQQKTRR